VARPNGQDTEDTEDTGDGDAAPARETGAGPCLACRGTGRLISGLGGTPHEVVCPWCRGTGIRIPGIDAQESPAETAPPA
jgi:DnaJ-class molecular chaperone